MLRGKVENRPKRGFGWNLASDNDPQDRGFLLESASSRYII
ncbi:hypothetical protein ALIPUT_01941 [Alistipes putredinis DSM 17216]|uniref:Uncharacterized protein n=1 Tax=Alistipes putredinis DSM 17216 TaxID=445970 RepID=B0MXS9_9BACT|nr:hypothetical protein ALIPUT_01941 [Alistipes putredinis DSM 17216]